MSAIEFLRDVGKHFSVNAMLGKESIAARLNGDGISYTEFSYMLLQSMDYLHLYRDHGCACRSAVPTSGATSPAGWISSAASRAGSRRTASPSRW